MDWKELRAQIPVTPGLAAPGARLEQLSAVVSGAMYKVLSA